MEAAEKINFYFKNSVFLKQVQLISEIRQLERSKGVIIHLIKIVGDTVYVEAKNTICERGMSIFELLELAYNLLIKHLPAGYRLAIEL